MKVIDFLYSIFILNAWIIPFICLLYGLALKYYLKNQGNSSFIFLTPIFCVAVSAVIFLTIPDINRASWEIITEISNIIYNGLAAVGIYELVKSTRKFILIYIMKNQLSKHRNIK